MKTLLALFATLARLVRPSRGLHTAPRALRGELREEARARRVRRYAPALPALPTGPGHDLVTTADGRTATARDRVRYSAAMRVCDHDPLRAREWSGLQRLTGHALQELADGGNALAEDILHMRITSWERRGLDVTAMMSEHGRGLTGALFDAIRPTGSVAVAPASAGRVPIVDPREDVAEPARLVRGYYEAHEARTGRAEGTAA